MLEFEIEKKPISTKMKSNFKIIRNWKKVKKMPKNLGNYDSDTCHFWGGGGGGAGVGVVKIFSSFPSF